MTDITKEDLDELERRIIAIRADHTLQLSALEKRVLADTAVLLVPIARAHLEAREKGDGLVEILKAWASWPGIRIKRLGEHTLGETLDKAADALAAQQQQIADKDAEIGRLREALDVLFTDHSYSVHGEIIVPKHVEEMLASVMKDT